MWIDLVKSLSTGCSFSAGASSEQISDLERSFNISLSDELKSILLETDGITGEYGLGLLWATSRIKAENTNLRKSERFRDNYMPFDSLLFFADGGNGDNFALSIINRTISTQGVYVWNHEDDSRLWVAPSIRYYLEWWMTNKIKI